MRKNLSFEAGMRRLHHDHYKQNRRRAKQAKRALRHENRRAEESE